jgi:hypothetical protein
MKKFMYAKRNYGLDETATKGMQQKTRAEEGSSKEI